MKIKEMNMTVEDEKLLKSITPTGYILNNVGGIDIVLHSESLPTVSKTSIKLMYFLIFFGLEGIFKAYFLHTRSN